MKDSRRIKRIMRHHKRSGNQNAILNMVSLMDIFTILVFFLLVTSSDSEILPTPKAIKLPESSAEKYPKQTLVIMVNDQDIRINDKLVTSIAEVKRNNKSTIPALKTALTSYRGQEKTGRSSVNKEAVTIMGDKTIPYNLLKKIMLTCANSEFSNISLAVVQKSELGMN
ncbi:MAG: biopolymer transporter ExbD [Gammaproteobacteria bacterium]|nr:biopolymer transporter ExbD [Gammaproteobacteria bacterium]